jgi:hypothetical protein
MKITKRQLRRIILEEKSRVLAEQLEPAIMVKSGNQHGQTRGENSQSYTDFATRLKEIHMLTESLGLDYVDSGWLADGDHASLATDVDELDRSADSLALAGEGLAQSMEE